MIAIAIVAVLFGLAIEWRREVKDRRGPAYDRARAVFAMRGTCRMPVRSGTDDPCVVIWVVAMALISSRLQRRWARRA
jgi:hypothetical protein